MKRAISQELIDEIMAQSDIVEVLRELGLRLKSAGKDHKGLCPFHDEKTPSFSVSSEKQFFYCFGCQTGGNLITFIKLHQQKTYIETIEFLAERKGISLPSKDRKSNEAIRERSKLFELNNFATDYFQRKLRSAVRASDYLKNRGVTREVIKKFQIGYAPFGPQDLLRSAQNHKFSKKQLTETGLIGVSRKGKVFDKFRDRVIFPIAEERGKIVAFGGRALSNSATAKYLNSANTPLFTKSKTLYNLHNARSTIAKTGLTFLVEGYFDVVMLAQFGVENVVASLGTSLTNHQAKLLRRFGDEVIIVYDGDLAGSTATLKGLNRLIGEGLRVRIAELPTGQDPDLLLRNGGREAFDRLIEKAINPVEFQIRRSMRHGSIRQIDVKSKTVAAIAETLAVMKSSIEISEYCNYAAKELEVDRAILQKELKRLGVKSIGTTKDQYGVSSENQKKSKKLSTREAIEWQLIEILILHPELLPIAEESFSPEDFTNQEFRAVAKILWQLETTDRLEIENLSEKNIDRKITGMVTELLMRNVTLPKPEARLEGCLKRLNQFLLLDMEKNMRSTVIAEGGNDLEALEELLALSKRRKKFGR